MTAVALQAGEKEKAEAERLAEAQALSCSVDSCEHTMSC